MNKKLDKRCEYYLVLDCETATLPCAENYEDCIKSKIAIAKPLIYDLGWKIIDKSGNTYARKSYLITEIFSVPQIFNTAYYAKKRPLYIRKLAKGEIKLASWQTVTEELVADLEMAQAVGAYNAMFDFKKALYFTEAYINALYSENYYEWEQRQVQRCDKIADGVKASCPRFDGKNFHFREKSYPLFDIWGLACENLLNTDDFRDFCEENCLYTKSEKYYSTTAETTYKFIKRNTTFEEAHMAVEDADIESEILAEIFKQVKPEDMTMGIIFFPFRIVGKRE